MSKQIFKGFKQVTAEQFNATEDKKGYLWFVRTPQVLDTNPESEGIQDVVEDDEYDIYFGSRQYGHFRAGELDAIRSSIDALAQKESADVDSILNLLQGYESEDGVHVDGVFDVLEQHADAIKTINNALGLKEGETTGETILDRVSNLESGVTETNERIDNLKATEVAYEPKNAVLSAATTVHEALESLVQVTVDNEKATALALTDLDERELALNGRVTTAETKLDILIGNDANKSARQIANEELAAQLLGEDNAEDNFRTLQQLAEWLENHPEDAAMMNAERAVFEAVLKDYVKRDENGVLVSASTVADAIKAINDALGLKEGETTGETILDRVSNLETDVTALSATTLSEVARLDNTLGSGVTTAYTVTDAINDAIQGSLHDITIASGETGINIDKTDPNNPVVSLVLEKQEDNVIPGHAEIVKGDSGLYAVMYYDGDDAE